MNKIALITGATSGIGKATATKLAEIGYNLIITGRRGDRLTALEDELKAKGIKVLALQFDVRNQQEVHNAISNLPAEWQNIDILVNNAGLAVGTSPRHHEYEIDGTETSALPDIVRFLGEPLWKAG